MGAAGTGQGAVRTGPQSLVSTTAGLGFGPGEAAERIAGDEVAVLEEVLGRTAEQGVAIPDEVLENTTEQEVVEERTEEQEAVELEPQGVVCFHQADVGEYLRDEETLC